MGTEDQVTRDQLTAISAKLDVLISQHSQLAGMVSDHETRIRAGETAQTQTRGTVAELGKDVADHEERLRAADRWRYALPVAALGALLAGAGSIVTAITKG